MFKSKTNPNHFRIYPHHQIVKKIIPRAETLAPQRLPKNRVKRWVNKPVIMAMLKP
jgi:hypothetical protein